MGIDPNELLYTEEEKQKTLRAFVKDGRLTEIPGKLKKRVIVLDWLAERFEPEKPYTEKQVSELLKTAHSDYCTLRRELVVTGRMDRENGVYVRKKG